MPADKQTPKELKVTDKRIFTPDGDIRDEFKQDIKPAEPQEVSATTQAAPSAVPPPAAASPSAERSGDERRQRDEPPPGGAERRRTLREMGENPATPFTNFMQGLIMQAYMMLGMLRNPYQPQTKVDVPAARELIDIVTLLKEKTSGNLTAQEEEFLVTQLGELKLAFVQITKSI